MSSSIRIIVSKAKRKIHLFLIYKFYIKNVHFITSTGRTGTNFFEHLFNSINNEVYSSHEPSPDFFDLSAESLRTTITSKEIRSKILWNRYSQLIKTVKKKKTVYIESNPFIFPIIDDLKKTFRKSKFLIITRDPKTYVQSALNKSPLDDDEIYFYSKEDKRKRLEPKDFYDDRTISDWESYNRVQKISWYWNKCNLYLYNFHKSEPKRSMIIKYESLFSQDIKIREKVISKVLYFFDIKVTNDEFKKLIEESFKKKNKTKEEKYKKYETWSKIDKINLKELTKEMCYKLNYKQ